MSYEQFANGEFGGPSPLLSEGIIRALELPEAFKALDCARWIAVFRQPPEGPLDIGDTAAELGVPVYRELTEEMHYPKACISGLGPDYGVKPIEVFLNPDRNHGDEEHSFGHEVGHLFLQTALGVYQEHGGRDKRVEDFCDFFGLRVAVPEAELREITEVSPEIVVTLMEKYGVALAEALTLLSLQGLVPKSFHVDSSFEDQVKPFFKNKVSRRVFCLDCELGRVHEPSNPDSVPALDLTQYQMATRSVASECQTYLDLDPDRIARVSKLYGRWTEEDESLLTAQRESHAEANRRHAEYFKQKGWTLPIGLE